MTLIHTHKSVWWWRRQTLFLFLPPRWKCAAQACHSLTGCPFVVLNPFASHNTKELTERRVSQIIKLRRPRQHTLTHAYTDTVSVPGYVCVCACLSLMCGKRHYSSRWQVLWVMFTRAYSWMTHWVSHFRRLNGLKFFFYIAEWPIQGREKEEVSGIERWLVGFLMVLQAFGWHAYSQPGRIFVCL